MRRILFTIVASTALFAAVPTVALAHSGHHHKRHHHSRIRHEKFVGHSHASDVNGVPATEPTAGTVTSFANNVLTITLTNGETVSGEVTTDTEVKCENPADLGDNDVEHGDLVSDHGPGGGGGGGDNGDQGDNNNDNQGDNNNDNAMCTITPGMAVRNAGLRIDGGGAFWDEVEVISSSTTATQS